MNLRFQSGITTLLDEHPDWIRGSRVGLLSHAAALDTAGRSSVELLFHHGGARLVALFGPEHGYFGAAGPGAGVGTMRHPAWRLPVRSLYGKHRKPTPAMLRDIDTLVFDLQDLAARPYTYVSTLRLLLEAAAENNKRVIVADRPVPLPSTLDGPVLDPAFLSFVASVPVPVSYGMTPGEAALWIRDTAGLKLDLHVATLKGYDRSPFRRPDWPPWIPPSPGMRSWESAWCYPATVFFEALPALDHARRTTIPFQAFGASWLHSRPLCERLLAFRLPGVTFHPHPYQPDPADPARLIDGVRLTVNNPSRFRPVLTGITILSAIQELYGQRRLWKAPGTRPEFFDKLIGTDSVRLALMDNATPSSIAKGWGKGITSFNQSRRKILLYP